MIPAWPVLTVRIFIVLMIQLVVTVLPFELIYTLKVCRHCTQAYASCNHFEAERIRKQEKHFKGRLDIGRECLGRS